MEIGGCIHIATHHHVVPGAEVGGLPLERIRLHACLARHHGPGAAGGFHGRCGDLLALQAFEIAVDATVLAANDHKRCAVVVLVHRLHHGGAWVLCVELHQRTDVAQPHLVHTASDTGDGGHRACARVDGDIQTFVPVVALVQCQKEGRGLSIGPEVQRELEWNGFAVLRKSQRGREGGKQVGARGEEGAALHGGVPEKWWS